MGNHQESLAKTENILANPSWGISIVKLARFLLLTGLLINQTSTVSQTTYVFTAESGDLHAACSTAAATTRGEILGKGMDKMERCKKQDGWQRKVGDLETNRTELLTIGLGCLEDVQFCRLCGVVNLQAELSIKFKLDCLALKRKTI